MTELEIMQRAKMYVDKLANGINPLTDQPAPEGDTVNQVRISRCLFYVSDVLRRVIENGGQVGGGSAPLSALKHADPDQRNHPPDQRADGRGNDDAAEILRHHRLSDRPRFSRNERRRKRKEEPFPDGGGTRPRDHERGPGQRQRNVSAHAVQRLRAAVYPRSPGSHFGSKGRQDGIKRLSQPPEGAFVPSFHPVGIHQKRGERHDPFPPVFVCRPA